MPRLPAEDRDRLVDSANAERDRVIAELDQCEPKPQKRKPTHDGDTDDGYAVER